MQPPVLHYLYDPLCGWCYGAAPLVAAARTVLPVVGHAGGMLTGENRRQVSAALRSDVMLHDRRIADLTGQVFGDAYVNDLLQDAQAVLDSAPPIAAILAAQAMAGRGLDMLARLQQGHYVEGRRIADAAVLRDLAIALGLDGDAFADAFQRIRQHTLQPHIDASRRLLAQVGAQGFPTFVLAQDGRMTVLDVGPWLGRPDAWHAHLAHLAPRPTA